MESVFHKHRWRKDPNRSIALAEIHARPVRVIGVLSTLRLADRTANGVLLAGHSGLNLQQLAARDYRTTLQISARVYALRDDDEAPVFDDNHFPSRNNYPGSSIALFEHVHPKLPVVDDTDLADHVD